VTVIAALAAPVLLGSILAVIAAAAPSILPVLPSVPESAAGTFAVPAALIAGTVLIAYSRQDRRTATDSTVL